MWMSATIEKANLPLGLIIKAEINIDNEYQQVNINLRSNAKKSLKCMILMNIYFS